MTSERTADADVATIREVLLIEKGLAVTSSFHDPALAALDRLVARNQQLQEALAVADALADAYGRQWVRDDKFYAYMDARGRSPK